MLDCYYRISLTTSSCRITTVRVPRSALNLPTASRSRGPSLSPFPTLQFFFLISKNRKTYPTRFPCPESQPLTLFSPFFICVPNASTRRRQRTILDVLEREAVLGTGGGEVEFELALLCAHGYSDAKHTCLSLKNHRLICSTGELLSSKKRIESILKKYNL